MVYETNHANVERDLLAKTNRNITIRLVLNNAHEHTEPGLTKMMNSIKTKCPLLFNDILPRSEHEKFNDDDGDESRVLHDAKHLQPKAVHLIKQRYAKSKLKLPVREKDMDVLFKKRYRRACESEYGLRAVYQFGKNTLSWWKKLSFNDP